MIAGLFIYFTTSALRYQVPPIAIDLQSALNLSLVDIGWLQTILGIAALILAIPAGFICMKLGTRNAVILTAAISLLGTVIGGFAANFEVLMIGRVFQGIALGLDAVVSFQVVAAFFPPEKRGFPNSLVSSSYVFAFFLMMNIAVPLRDVMNWQGLWYFCDVLSILAIILALVCIPKKDKELIATAEKTVDAPKMQKGSTRAVWLNPMIWLPALTFTLFNVGYFGIATYYPTFLVEVVHADQEIANLIVSGNALIGVPGAICAGLIMNRLAIPKRKLLPAFTMIGLAICYFVAFYMPDLVTATILMLVVGFICCFVPPSLYTIGPDIVRRPEWVALALAIVTVGQNVGMSLGPVVVGAIVESAGDWTACAIPIGVMALVGAVSCFLIKVKPADKGADEAVSIIQDAK